MAINPLNADMNVIQALVIPELGDDLDIIQKLDDEPNDVGGLTAAELKAKFDESGNVIQNYLNATLLPAISDTVAEAEQRAQAEAERLENEAARVAAEQGRVSAESGRVDAENARVQAESGRVSAENARAQAEGVRAREEQSRAQAENARAQAERGRVDAESSRVTAESGRVDAETARVQAENLRAQGESARKTAEESRVRQEAARVEAETARGSEEAKRFTAESARAQAEQQRATAESGRGTAEGRRVEAEKGRTAAEEARVSAETARAGAEAGRAHAEQARADENTGIVARATAQAQDAADSAQAAAAAKTEAQSAREAAGVSAAAAQQSATAAGASATAAAGSAFTASTKAGEAAGSATAAQDSKAAAERAKTAAEEARDGAVGAKTAAEAARTGAETANAAAQQARTDAAAAAGNAAQDAAREAAADTAEAVRTEMQGYVSGASASAATAKTEADRAKSEADRASDIVGGNFATASDVANAVAAHDAAAEAHAELFNVILDRLPNFIVTISQSGDTYSADKTNAEIFEAFEAGQNVVAQGELNLYTLVGCSSTYAIFCITAVTQGFIVSEITTIEDNAVTVESTQLPLLDSKTFLVTVSGASGNLTADHTFDEIAAAIDMGLNVFVLYGEMIHQLSYKNSRNFRFSSVFCASGIVDGKPITALMEQSIGISSRDEITVHRAAPITSVGRGLEMVGEETGAIQWQYGFTKGAKLLEITAVKNEATAISPALNLTEGNLYYLGLDGTEYLVKAYKWFHTSGVNPIQVHAAEDAFFLCLREDSVTLEDGWNSEVYKGAGVVTLYEAVGAQMPSTLVDNMEMGEYGNLVKAPRTGGHVEGGSNVLASGCAHVEGFENQVPPAGFLSHVEGRGNVAAGEGCHVEGGRNTVRGAGSHVEGIMNTVNEQAVCTHIEGEGHICSSAYQHVQGIYSVQDPGGSSGAERRGAYAHIVGNGESDTVRSNAHTLDWSGNGWFAGDVLVGGTGQDDPAAVRLAKAARSLTATLLASAWTGTVAPFTQTVSVADMTAAGNGFLDVAHNATAVQRAAAREALLSITAQTSGALTITADGEKPAVDIPVNILIVG